MRWFDRAYISGELDEDEWTARPLRYLAHLDSIRDELDHGAESLATLNLHDSQVADWGIGEENDLTLRLLAGDLQGGYTWLTLRYREMHLFGATVDDLDGWFGGNRITEIVGDEVSLATGGIYEHRPLLDPDGEFGIRFESLGVSSANAPASARRFSPGTKG